MSLMFVDRKEELDMLARWVRGRHNILLLGLRGYGKTSLLRMLLKLLASEGMRGVLIDCLRVYNGSDLLLEFLRSLQEHNIRVDRSVIREIKLLAWSVSPKDAIIRLFDYAENIGLDIVAFDEISTMIRRFSVFKPFRRAGGAVALGELLKSMLDRARFSVIMCDTSINALYELFREYTGPLFRQYSALLVLDPLDLSSARELVARFLDARKISLDRDAVECIVEFSGGVPQYIKMIIGLIHKPMTREELEEEIKNSLLHGFLNDYFRALLEKFSAAEQEVLYIMSRGYTRFGEIADKAVNAAAALESLYKKGIVLRIAKSGRKTHYIIRDKLFSTWLAINEFPRLKKLSFERAKLFYIGLEAIAREIFLTLSEPVTIKDVLGHELTIEPTKSVERYEGTLGEIDILAVSKSNATYVAEVYGGLKCPKKKFDELLRAMHIAEVRGYKNIIGLLITYFSITEDALKYAKQLWENDIRIYVLTEEHLRKLSMKSQIRI